MITRTARARYQGMGKDGQGWVSTQSGVLSEQRYGFGTRFENEPGTNPEELIAAAHAGCFTMALSFALAFILGPRINAGGRIGRSDLTLDANVPLDEDRLRELAEEAKANCPVSKLLNAEMALEVRARQAA